MWKTGKPFSWLVYDGQRQRWEYGGGKENEVGNNATLVSDSGNNATAEDLNDTKTDVELNVDGSGHVGSVNEEDGTGAFTWLREAGLIWLRRLFPCSTLTGVETT